MKKTFETQLAGNDQALDIYLEGLSSEAA